MKAILLNIISFLFFFITITGQEKDTLLYRSLQPYDFHITYLLDDNSILIDVREFFEYKKSRIHGALNIPSSGNLEMSADSIEKDKSLFFYCSSGFRSKRVANYFSEHGFTKVYNLDGGINAWQKETMPVEKKKLKRV